MRRVGMGEGRQIHRRDIDIAIGAHRQMTRSAEPVVDHLGMKAGWQNQTIGLGGLGSLCGCPKNEEKRRYRHGFHGYRHY